MVIIRVVNWTWKPTANQCWVACVVSASDGLIGKVLGQTLGNGDTEGKCRNPSDRGAFSIENSILEQSNVEPILIESEGLGINGILEIGPNALEGDSEFVEIIPDLDHRL